jgi:type IV secretory pathway component VirB8
MTQHFYEEHTREDQRAMRSLALVVGIFMAATAVMAVTIAVVLG